MTEDYEIPMELNGYLSTSGFPENNYEPDDSDDVYYNTYQELEEAVNRTQQQARSWKISTTPTATTKPTA